MSSEVAELSLRWNYSLEEILGLILVAGVVGAYSLMFALTRQPRRGWAITACVSFTLMAAMTLASPPQPRAAVAAIAEAGM